MGPKCFEIGTFIVAFASMALAQTQPVFRPPPGYVPPGVNVVVPAATSAIAHPGTLEAGLFVQSLETADNETFPLVVEVSNKTDASVSFPSRVFFEYRFDDIKAPRAPTFAPTETSGDDVMVMLRMTVPYKAGMTVGVPSLRLFRFKVLPDDRGMPDSDSKQTATSVILTKSGNMLGRLDLTAGMLKPGLNKLELVLLQHGNVIAHSPELTVHCGALAPEPKPSSQFGGGALNPQTRP